MLRALAELLAPLRDDLDVMPSPVPDRPGLLIRDPLGYTDSVLIVPPPLVPLLRFFDGRSEASALRRALAELAGGAPEAEGVLTSLLGALGGGFLVDATFRGMRERAHAEFAAAAVREPSHLGDGGYPGEAGALRRRLDAYLAGRPVAPEDGGPAPANGDGGPREAEGEGGDGLLAIAAPHVSPSGGFRSYAAAYRELGPRHAGRTFVVLGTSHHGAPETFGLTLKPFRTPYGDAPVDTEIVERLAAAAPSAVVLEDYCHKVEHSIEFQVVFLQHALGPSVRIVPILVGPFARSLLAGGLPEDDTGVASFLEALAELQRREAGRLLWVLGVDMAHVGRRYGDRFAARADEGALRDVRERDHERLERVAAGDAAGFWELVRPNADALRWCGAAPLYAFLRAAPQATGRLLRYEQWNIDEASVVSFAALRFAARG